MTDQIISASIINNTLDVKYRKTVGFNLTNPFLPNLTNNLPVVVDNEGNILVAGTELNSQTYDMNFAIYKFNNSGKPISSFGNSGKIIQDISGNSFDTVNDMKIDSNNNIYVFGTYQSIGSDDIKNAIVKYNSSGNIVTAFGNNGISYIDIQDDTGYLVMGRNFIYTIYSSGNVYLYNLSGMYVSNYNISNLSNSKVLYDNKTNKILNVYSNNTQNIYFDEYDNYGVKTTTSYQLDYNIENEIYYTQNNNGNIFILVRDTNFDDDAQERLFHLIKFTNISNPQPDFDSKIDDTTNYIYTSSASRTIIINSDNNSNTYLLYSNNVDNIWVYKYDNIGKVVATFNNNIGYINIVIPNQIYIFNNITFNIYENNLYIDCLKMTSTGNIQSFFEIQNYNINGIINTNFGTNGIFSNIPINIISEPVDMILDNNNNIIIGGSTFYDKFDFAVMKCDQYGNLIKSFGNDGSFHLDICGNSLDTLYNLVLSSDGTYFVMIGTYTTNNNTNIVLVQSDMNGQTITYHYITYQDINIDEILSVNIFINNNNNNYNYNNNNNIYIIFNDNQNNNYITSYNFNTKIQTDKFQLNNSNIPTLCINNSNIYILDYQIIKNEYNITIQNIVDGELQNIINLNLYYNNINNIISILNTSDINNNLYILVNLNVNGNKQFILFRFIYRLLKDFITKKFILDNTFNNSGYINNNNYITNSLIQSDSLSKEINNIFSNNLTTKKILCDSELYITIGGSYSTDLCGNNICLFKIDYNGIINYVTNSKKILNTTKTPYNDGINKNYSQNNSVNSILYSFTNNIFGDIIVSYYIYGNFINYINNCNFIKLDKNLVYIKDGLTDTKKLKISTDNININIPIISIPNILIDSTNNIYNIFYNMVNYPNDKLYSIAFDSSNDRTFYIYKDTFRLNNLTQNLIPLLTYNK
jgi:hypothetical protein